MKYKILPITALLFSSFLQAQQPGKVFAVMADNNPASPYQWMNMNELDVKTGQVTKNIFDHTKTSFEVYEGASNQKRGSSLIPQAPGLIAAAAYDVRHGRLFVAPMFTPELRWIDMDENNSSMKMYALTLPFTTTDLTSEANHITRMAIAADGYGYALTNDANHLLRFTIGKSVTVTDLGAVKDGPENADMNVHSKISFGGDMVSDADGNLYVFTAAQNVFKVNLTSMRADYVAKIKNLPAAYTLNGAAVDEDGSLIVSSASMVEGLYRVDMNTWEATTITNNNKNIGISDLASNYFAFQKKTSLVPAVLDEVKAGNGIGIYPNPVTASTFKVSFNNKETGRYVLQVTDESGRIAMQQTVNLQFQNQAIDIKMPRGVSNGMYTVKLVDAKSKPVSSSKILVNQ